MASVYRSASAHTLAPSLAAEAIIAALNQSMDLFDQAPAASVLEQKVIRWLCELVGLPGPPPGFHCRRNAVELHGAVTGEGSFPVVSQGLGIARARFAARIELVAISLLGGCPL